MALAAAEIVFQRRQGQQGIRRLPQIDLHHSLGQVLIALHDVKMHRVTRCTGAVPLGCRLHHAQIERDSAKHCIQIRQKARLSQLDKPEAEGFQRTLRIARLPGGHLAAGQQTEGSKFNIRRSRALDFIQPGHQGQHPGSDIAPCSNLLSAMAQSAKPTLSRPTAASTGSRNVR